MDRRIRIVHEEELNDYFYRRLNFILNRFLSVYFSRFRKNSLWELKIEIRAMEKNGGGKKFEIKTDLFCNMGIFSSGSVSWSLYGALRKSMRKIKYELFRN